MADNIGRKELKEPDKFVSKTSMAIEWLQKNWKLVALGLGGVAACVLLIHAFIWFRESKEKEASQLLVEALKILDAPIDQSTGNEQKSGTFKTESEKLAAALSAMQKVSESYGSTRTAALSRYFIAEILRRQEKYEEAIKTFKEFLATISHDSDFAVYAIEGIGACLEAQGKLDEARLQYESATKPPFDFEPDRALYNMARIDLQKGLREDAAGAFRNILEKYPNTTLRRDIQQRLASIKMMSQESKQKDQEKEVERNNAGESKGTKKEGGES